jgi:M6 family metalloprotease-like protein
MLAITGGVCCIMEIRRLSLRSIGMRRFLPRSAYATLLALLAILPIFAEQPIDLSEYRTVANAKTATTAALVGAGEQRPAYLGVNAEPEAGSLRVMAVEPDSPAARIDIRVGDRLRSVDGASVVDLATLRETLLNRHEGDRIIIGAIRDGKSIDFAVTLGAPSHPLTVTPRRLLLGVALAPSDSGVRVERLTPNMPAERAGVRVGDVLLKVGSAAIASQEALADILNNHRPGDRVQLVLKREGKEVSVEAQLVGDTNERSRRGQDDMPSLARWDDRRPNVFRGDTYHLAVIEVAFPDAKANDKITTAEWQKALFSKGEYKDKNATGQAVYGSMNDYYQELSCGKFQVNGKVFAPVTCSKKRAEYSTSGSRFAMFTESLDLVLARDGKDALQGYDGLFFVYAGPRVQTQRGGIYWPHKSNLFYQGKRWNYFICPEGGDRMSSISVTAHEFGHMLGLPDLYAKPENPGSEGVGVWCTMSTGHGRDGKPLHFCAWSKEQLGWIKPCVIDPRVKQKLILSPIESSPGECYKVLVRPDSSEYLLLEYRLKKGYDRDIPGEGLLIWRVVDGKPVLEESHGIGGPDGPMRFLGSVPYPSKANTAFTPYTTPSSKPSKPGGVPVHITNIRKLPDGRIAFHVGYEYV